MDAATDNTAAIRARLIAVTADLSGYPEGDLDADKTFLQLGFDSLFLTQLATAFQSEFGAPVAFRQLVADQPTINILAAHLAPMVTKQLKEEASPPAEDINTATQMSAPIVKDQPSMKASPPGDVSGLSAVFARQLDLMRDQMEILRAVRQGAPNQETLDASEPAPIANPPAMPHEPPADAPALPTGFGPTLADSEGGSLTAMQRAHIDRLSARYNAKTSSSKMRAQEGRARHADPRTAAGFNTLWKEMVYPVVVKRSKGAYLWDIDDNQYIDLLNGFGPNFFGHRAPFVMDALREQLGDGFEIGPQTPLAADAATLLCELTGMDRASWVNTGSEAVQAAIRIARTVTGRNKIALFRGSYHGNFDEVLVRAGPATSGAAPARPMAPGVPASAVENVLVLDYGEESALHAIAEHADELAAVLVEPVQSRRPEFLPKEFLHKLRAITEREGVALVFDEVVTGFRVAPGGAQEVFDIKADLATFGKIIGGGMPIGAVAGRAKFMDTFDGGQWRFGDASQPTAGVTFFAGTFVRHPLAIAAAHASLAHLKDKGPALQQHAAALAERLANELNAFFAERGVDFHVAQSTSQMFIRIEEKGELAPLFFYHMRERGVHVLEGFPCYMTTAHSDEDVDMIVAAAKDSILEMQADGLLPGPKHETEPGFQRKLPLTSGQRTIWATSQLSDMASCAFNESDSIHTEGDLDIAAFTAATNAAIVDHEAFSLRFDGAGEYQYVADGPNAQLEYQDLRDAPESDRQRALDEETKRDALTPFDLERGPLVRLSLYQMGEKSFVFVIYAHHLVFDGYSSDILIRDIVGRYRALIAGQTPRASGADPFSAYIVKSIGATATPEYWRGVFADGAPPTLDLPTDRRRSQQMSYQGATARRVLSGPLCKGLRDTARSLGVSMAALTTAAFASLLGKLTGREDLVVGAPIAGQARHGVDAIGYCVNVVPVRIRPFGDLAFSAFAKSVQSDLLNAFEHSEVSVSELISAIAAPRLPGRPQLVEAVFNFAGYFAGLDAPGVRFNARENRRYAVCQDVFMNLSDAGESLVIDLDYASDLFNPDTIENWIDQFTAILADIVRNPETRLAQMESRERDETVVAIADRQTSTVEAPVAAPAESPTAMSDTEICVAEAAAAVFARESVSIDDNFFDLGGHSIHASRLLTRLRRAQAPNLGVRAIFETENLRALAAHIDALETPEQGEREEFVF